MRRLVYRWATRTMAAGGPASAGGHNCSPSYNETRTITMQRGLTKLWKFSESPISGGGLVARILAGRGITDPVASAAYLDPNLRDLADPSLIPDLDRAAERILGALASGRPLVIYGDYDVDGISATAILYHTFKAIRPSADVRTYVPHRLDEGYGLNRDALLKMAAEGVGLVV